MCYFITVAVHPDYDAKLQERLKADYSIVNTANPSLLKMLPANFKAYVIITGMCSCDLYSKPQDSEIEAEKIRKKYRSPKFKKAGWTEAKIDRAINESIAALKPQPNGLRPALRSALCDIVSQSKNLSLIVHYYSGGVETETFGILDRTNIRCAELLTDDWAIEQDKIIELK